MAAAAMHVVITGDPRPFQKALGGAGGSLDKFGAKQKSVSARLNGAGKTMTRGLTVPLVALGAASVKVAADFEQQMSSVAAVTDAPRSAIEKLRDAALKAGADTAFSAKEAALAETELAKGGLSAAKILGGGLKGALSLAAAGQLELGDAAAITANSLNLFGLNGSQAGHVADALATAANATTADVADFGAALGQAGGVAKSAGFTFNETVTALEALAASGVKNSDAGTSLKTTLIQLLKPSEKQAALADQLGLKFTTQEGKMKSLAAISAMLRDRTGDMTKAQRTATLAQLAGTDGVRTLTALYDAGPSKLKRYQQGLEKQGSAAETAAKKQDNLKGKLEQLHGSAETLGIIVGSALIPPLTNLAQKATQVANDVGHAFQSLSPDAQQVVIASGIALAALGPLVSMAGRVAGAFEVMRSGWSLFGIAITPLRVLLVGAGIAFAVLGGHVGTLQDTLGGMGHVVASVGSAIGSVAQAVGHLLAPVGQVIQAFAQSEVAAGILRGALVALVGAGIGIMAARLAAIVGPALMFMRALFSVAGATTVLAIGMQRLKVALVTNPLTALLTVVGFVAGALGVFNSKTEESRVTQQQYRDAILQTRDALDRLRDAQGGVKDADLAAREAALNLKEAELQKKKVYANSKSTALELQRADLAVARARREDEKATTAASRAHRDLSAQQKKATSDAQESISTLRKHRDQVKHDVDALKALEEKVGKNIGISKLLTAKQRELADAQGSLTAEEKRTAAATQKMSDKMANAASSAKSRVGSAMGSIVVSLGSVSGVHVDMSEFLGSISAGLSAAETAINDAVGRMRAKLKQASPGAHGSPSPNEIIAGGFVGLGKVIDAGYAAAIGRTTAGTDALRDIVRKSAYSTRDTAWFLYPTDEAIQKAERQLEKLQNSYDKADRAATLAQAKRDVANAKRAAAKAAKASHHVHVKRRHGEKKDDYAARVKDAKREAKDKAKETKRAAAEARGALAALIRDERRAQAAAAIEFTIKGLERLRDFQNAMTDIHESLDGLVDTAVQGFVDDRLKRELAAIDSGAQSLELAGIREVQAQRARDKEDADIATRRLKATTREAKATDVLAKANADLARAQSSGSARLIAAAQRRVQFAQSAVTTAKAGVAAVESDASDLADDRRAQELEKSIADAKDAAQKRADAAQDGNDQEVTNFRATLAKKLQDEWDSLQTRKQTYAQFVQDVNTILAGVAVPGTPALTFEPSQSQEAAVAAPGPIMRPAIKLPPKKKKPPKKHHAQGGEVSRRMSEFARINELGNETAVLPAGTRIITAGGSGRGDAPTIGELHVHDASGNPTKTAFIVAQTVARELSRKRR